MKKSPVLAGVCATDPFRDIPRFLKQLKDLGFAGTCDFNMVFSCGPKLQRRASRRVRLSTI